LTPQGMLIRSVIFERILSFSEIWKWTPKALRQVRQCAGHQKI
jgi:hypothetical protein